VWDEISLVRWLSGCGRLPTGFFVVETFLTTVGFLKNPDSLSQV